MAENTNTERDYPPLPEPAATGLGDEYEAFDRNGRPMGKAYETIVYFKADQMRAYVDADRAARASLSLPAAGQEPVAFPGSIMALLREVADRKGTGARGPWQDGKGNPMQDAADAAIAWICARAAPQPAPVREPQPMPDLTQLTERGATAWAGVDAQWLREARWYMVNKDGMPTLCADKKDAEREATFSDKAWPSRAPHRVVQLVEAGRASLSANAGEPSGHIKEPYTLAEIKAKIASNDYSAEMLLQHAMLLLDSASLAASAGSEPVAGMNEYGVRGYLAATLKCWHRLTGDEAAELVAMTQRLAGLYLHPSPPEGMVGGWNGGSHD